MSPALISVLWTQRDDCYDQGLDVTKTGSYCKLGNNGGWRVDAAKAAVSSEVDKISSLKEEQETTLKGFSLW